MEEEYPLVSIITPTHNIVDKELTDEFSILVSLLNKQSYPNIEHIVIDKSSNDGTVQLLADYKSKGYLQFYSEPDSGKYDALNKGIMRAKGKYVAFLNCDDFMHNILAVEEMVNTMEEYDADYTFGTANAIHPEGYVFEFSPAMYNVFQVMPCALQAMMFKRTALAEEGYFDLKFKQMADFDLIMRFVLKERNGIMYERNYVTYTLSPSIFEEQNTYDNESRAVYIKNFKNLYPLTNDIVDNIVKFSEMPQGLLDILSKYYPEENKEDFFAACEEMHRIRLEAQNPQSDAAANDIAEVSQGDSVQENSQIQSQPLSAPGPGISINRAAAPQQMRQTPPLGLRPQMPQTPPRQ